MINMIQNAKDQAASLTMAAYQAAAAAGKLPQAEVKTAPVEIPKDTRNGDFTTTFALSASKALRMATVSILPSTTKTSFNIKCLPHSARIYTSTCRLPHWIARL